MLATSVIRDVIFKQKLADFFSEKADILKRMPRGYTNKLANEFGDRYPEYDLLSVAQFRNQLDRWRRAKTPAEYCGCGMNANKKKHLARVDRVKEFLKSVDPLKLYSVREEYNLFINSPLYEGMNFKLETYRDIRREIKNEMSKTPSLDNVVNDEDKATVARHGGISPSLDGSVDNEQLSN